MARVEHKSVSISERDTLGEGSATTADTLPE